MKFDRLTRLMDYIVEYAEEYDYNYARVIDSLGDQITDEEYDKLIELYA